jgi:peptide/nickel transport system permease protein
VRAAVGASRPNGDAARPTAAAARTAVSVILSRIIWGTRVSLQIGLIVIGIAASIGFTLGSASGYFRGPFDGFVMRIMDIILAFPPLILAMAIASFLGPDLNNAMLAIAVVHIPKYTRLARSEALALRESLFVLAARSVGASDRRVILRHIMPNSLASILIVASLDFGLVILTAASLGFIGLGAQPPTPDWGLMVADGRKYLVNAPWVATFPGLTIVLVVIAANVFGDGLRDILDPRLRM